MKRKIICLIIFALFTFGVMAQKLTPLPAGTTTATASLGYVLTNTMSKYWRVNTNLSTTSTQVLTVSLHKTSGSQTSITTSLYGRVSGLDGWTYIDAETWGLTSADTVLHITNNEVNTYTQFRVVFSTQGTGVSSVVTAELRLYEQTKAVPSVTILSSPSDSNYTVTASDEYIIRDTVLSLDGNYDTVFIPASLNTPGRVLYFTTLKNYEEWCIVFDSEIFYLWSDEPPTLKDYMEISAPSGIIYTGSNWVKITY